MISKYIIPLALTGWGYLLSASSLQVATGAENTFIENLVSLGVGGIIAAIVLWWKRKDDEERRIDDKEHKDEILRITAKHQDFIERIIDNSNRREDKMIEALEKTATALQDLTTVVDRVSSRSDLEKQLAHIVGAIGKREEDRTE